MEAIDIKKQEPETIDHYIVLDPTTNAKVFPAYWNGEEFGNFIGIFDWHSYEGITHYMELPKAEEFVNNTN